MTLHAILGAIACFEAIVIVGFCVNGLYEVNGLSLIRQLVIGPGRCGAVLGLLRAVVLQALAILGACVWLWILFYQGRPTFGEIALGGALTALSVALATRPSLVALSSRP